jgi:cytochrome c oxidase assembly factor CtaG
MNTGSKTRFAAAAALGIALAPAARAHEGAGGGRGWSLEPGIVAALFVAGALYVCGLKTLRERTHSPRKLRGAARCFAAGWALLVVALVSPVQAWSARLFSVHMVQHELLMVAAAPLLVLGRLEPVMLSALPRGLVRAGRRAARASRAETLWRRAAAPWVATTLHALALWAWHVPAWFAATARSELVHALQHASFFATAVLFWRAVFFGPRRRAGYGLAVGCLFLTALHSGVIGALITFAARLWYPSTGGVFARASLTPFEDQQLGGLIMWVPAGLVYVAAALVLFGRWLRESGRAPLALPPAPVGWEVK